MTYLTLKRILLASVVILSTNTLTAGPGPKTDPIATSETCRQLAIKIDWLGRYQDRATCIANLNGLDTFSASQLILAKNMKEAQPLLNDAILHTKYAIDIGCYGQDDMKAVLRGLQDVLQTIS